jgi:hypothetical protein
MNKPIKFLSVKNIDTFDLKVSLKPSNVSIIPTHWPMKYLYYIWIFKKHFSKEIFAYILPNLILAVTALKCILNDWNNIKNEGFDYFWLLIEISNLKKTNEAFIGVLAILNVNGNYFLFTQLTANVPAEIIKSADILEATFLYTLELWFQWDECWKVIIIQVILHPVCNVLCLLIINLFVFNNLHIFKYLISRNMPFYFCFYFTSLNNFW